MNILILNWRDPKNPKSGGAEKLNMHILKPLIDRGDSVIWYAMFVKGFPRKEKFKGITIIRFGNPLTHLIFWPILYWSGRLGKPDFIIDSIHGTGYLSSLIAPSKKKVILICEIAQNIWDEMYVFPINIFGKFWEKIMFLFYRNNNFWTISDSTKKDLVTFGVEEKNIEVLPMGFDGIRLSPLPAKYKEPTALFVGRLAEMKGVKDAIQAIAQVNKKADKKWRLHIIGRGDANYEKELNQLVSDLSISDYIKFFGYVDEKKKFEEMAKAWVLLVPSSREGWGMIVPEANSVRTPVIGYDVPGLRDVITKYSSENILVNSGSKNIEKAINDFDKPLDQKVKIEHGWNELYGFVIKNDLLKSV